MIALLKLSYILYRSEKKLHRLILFYITLPFYYSYLKIRKFKLRHWFKYYVIINTYGNKVTVKTNIDFSIRGRRTLPFIGEVSIYLGKDGLTVKVIGVTYPSYYIDFSMEKQNIDLIVGICNLFPEVYAKKRDVRNIRRKLMSYING